MLNAEITTHSNTYVCDLSEATSDISNVILIAVQRFRSNFITLTSQGGETFPIAWTEVYPDPSFTIENP
jgi:hypothetical protein